MIGSPVSSTRSRSTAARCIVGARRSTDRLCVLSCTRAAGGSLRRHVKDRSIKSGFCATMERAPRSFLVPTPYVPDLQVLHDDDRMILNKAARRLVLGVNPPAHVTRWIRRSFRIALKRLARSLFATRNRLLSRSKLPLLLRADARQVEDRAIARRDGVSRRPDRCRLLILFAALVPRSPVQPRSTRTTSRRFPRR